MINKQHKPLYVTTGKLILLLMLCSNAFAQRIYDQKVKLKDLIQESGTIIKGIRITRTPQYFYLNGTIFNSVQVKVLEVYKGALQPGELIEYTTEGGMLNGKEHYPEPNGGLVGTKEYILILTPSPLDNRFEDSLKVFSSYKPGYSHIMLTESTFSALYKTQQFKTLNDVYHFLDENGLHIPHNKNDPKNQTDPHTYRKQYLKQPDGVEVERVESGFKFKGLDSVRVGKEPLRFDVELEEEGGN